MITDRPLPGTPAPAVIRAAAVLRAIAAADGIARSVSELAEEVDLRRLTPRSHATLEALLADLATTRTRGYALDDEEAAPNVVCLAVALPVLDRPPSAVSTTLFKYRLKPELQDRLVQDLHSLASHLASR